MEPAATPYQMRPASRLTQIPGHEELLQRAARCTGSAIGHRRYGSLQEVETRGPQSCKQGEGGMLCYNRYGIITDCCDCVECRHEVPHRGTRSPPPCPLCTFVKESCDLRTHLAESRQIIIVVYMVGKLNINIGKSSSDVHRSFMSSSKSKPQ